MKARIVEQIELFSKEELHSLELLPEELEAIEAERVPDFESITFEDIAEDLGAVFEQDSEAVLEALPWLAPRPWWPRPWSVVGPPRPWWPRPWPMVGPPRPWRPHRSGDPTAAPMKPQSEIPRKPIYSNRLGG